MRSSGRRPGTGTPCASVAAPLRRRRLRGSSWSHSAPICRWSRCAFRRRARRSPGAPLRRAPHRDPRLRRPHPRLVPGLQRARRSRGAQNGARAPALGLRRVRERLLEDVERLLGRDGQLEALPRAAVLDRDQQPVRRPAPEQRHLDAVGRAVVELGEDRIGHGSTVARGKPSLQAARTRLEVRPTPYSRGRSTPRSVNATRTITNATTTTAIRRGRRAPRKDAQPTRPQKTSSPATAATPITSTGARRIARCSERSVSHTVTSTSPVTKTDAAASRVLTRATIARAILSSW